MENFNAFNQNAEIPNNSASSYVDSANIQRQYEEIIRSGNENRAFIRKRKDAVLSTMMINASRNNGFVSPDIIPAAARDLGIQNLVGGSYRKDGSFILYTGSKDQNGRDVLSAGIIARPEQQLEVLQRSGLGDDLRCSIYDGLSKKYTEQQLNDIGILSPYRATPIRSIERGIYQGNSINGTIGSDGKWVGTDSGAKPGPRPRYYSDDDFNGTPMKDENRPGSRYFGHGISTFSTTSYNSDVEDKRHPDGLWKVISSGPSRTGNGSNDTVYENSKTGEKITVKDGENLRDVLSKYNIYSSYGKRGSLGLRDAQSRSSSGSGMTAEEKIEYLREKEKLQKDRELAVQGSRNEAKEANKKPNNMSSDMLNALVTIMQNPDMMKNNDIKSLVSGIKAQYGIGDGSVTPTGVSGSLYEAKKGDAMSRDQLTDEELKLVDSAEPPEGWCRGTKIWDKIKKENPLEVLRYIDRNDRQLVGEEQHIEYKNQDGTVVHTNGFRDKSGRIYGVRKGIDGKNYRGDEINDYSKQKDVVKGEVSKEIVGSQKESSVKEKKVSRKLVVYGVPRNLIDEFVKKNPNESLDDDDFEYSKEGLGMNGVSKLERFLYSKNPSYAKNFKDAIDAKRAANVDKTKADDEAAIQKDAEALGLGKADVELLRMKAEEKRAAKKRGKKSPTRQDREDALMSFEKERNYHGNWSR